MFPLALLRRREPYRRRHRVWVPERRYLEPWMQLLRSKMAEMRRRYGRTPPGIGVSEGEEAAIPNEAGARPS